MLPDEVAPNVSSSNMRFLSPGADLCRHIQFDLNFAISLNLTAS
jgi:hypothetical protein